jgi:CheY-like chemotaxis protein
MLRNAGAEVVGVATLRDAKDHLKYGGFDAAVLDLHLVTSPARSPHGHGLRAVSAALREGVPVVVATVYTLRQFTDAARAHGLKRSDLKRVIYVGKPFDTPALVQAIGSATGRTGGTVH